MQVAKTTTFKRCMNLKPQKTKVHLLKFMVNCFFSHFYQVCISKRFFHSRSSHFTFGSDCTVCWSWDPTTARKSGIAETSFLRSSSPTQQCCRTAPCIRIRAFPFPFPLLNWHISLHKHKHWSQGVGGEGELKKGQLRAGAYLGRTFEGFPVCQLLI